MDYLLMNKDDRLLAFQTSPWHRRTVALETASYSDGRPLGWKGIDDWVQSRNSAKHKEHLKGMLKEWQMDTVDGFLQVSHALSLNDTLWVRPEASTLRWADVSLYSNPFDDIAARTAFEKGLHGLQLSSTSPEFTSEGSYPKCWRQEDDGIMLYKTVEETCANSGQEPYVEFMSSWIAGMMEGVVVVPYDLATFKGSLCSTCRLFTSEATGFVPAYKVFGSPWADATTIALDCGRLGFAKEYEDMLVVDAITLNTDRHLGNFGFLVNNDTFEIKSFAPLFDFNRSMLCFAMQDDLETSESVARYVEDCHIEHKLGISFIQIGEELMTPERRSRLPKAISLPRHPRYNPPAERLERLNEIFQEHYSLIRNPGKPGAIHVKPLQVLSSNGKDLPDWEMEGLNWQFQQLLAGVSAMDQLAKQPLVAGQTPRLDQGAV